MCRCQLVISVSLQVQGCGFGCATQRAGGPTPPAGPACARLVPPLMLAMAASRQGFGAAHGSCMVAAAPPHLAQRAGVRASDKACQQEYHMLGTHGHGAGGARWCGTTKEGCKCETIERCNANPRAGVLRGIESRSARCNGARTGLARASCESMQKAARVVLRVTICAEPFTVP